MGNPTTMPTLDAVIGRLEQIDALDGVARKVSGVVSDVTHRTGVVSLLSGTWIGHPLHPILTDLPIGSWTSAFVLDLVGGKRARPAAQTLVGLGVLTAVPTAVTGLSDWADTVGSTRRIGAFHALTNIVGLGCYVLLWRARRRGPPLPGRRPRHGRRHCRHRCGGAAWRPPRLPHRHRGRRERGRHRAERLDRDDVGVVAALAGEGRYVEVGPAKALALHDGPGGWHGIGARCSHRDGPLQEGAFEDGCVVCPVAREPVPARRRHRGQRARPAPQPRYEVRERDGALVRAAG